VDTSRVSTVFLLKEKGMKKILSVLWNYLEEICTVFLFFLLLLVVFVQVASRVLFNSPLMFTEELARFLYVWIMFTGIGWMYKKRKNIALDLVFKVLSPRNKHIFDIVVNIVTIVTFSILIYWSFGFIRFQMVNPAPALRFPMGFVYSIGPVAMVVGIVRIVQNTIEDIRLLKAEGAEAAKEGV
jgi:TRAP-type C4-dicarboxylate transport system permease small subunit